jgi:VWFA-related protein
MTPQRFFSILLAACLVNAQTPVQAPPAQSASPQAVPQTPPQATPQAAPQAPPAGTPVIKMTTRLMQVSVVVQDKKGEPVPDLTKDDFILYDKGQEQKIRYLSKEGDQPPPENLPALAEGVVSNLFVNTTVDGKTRVQPLPNSLTAILLDGLNTKFTDQHYAKEALVKFLKQLHPGDQVAIYTLSNGLRVLHDFTSDTASLLAALDRHHNQESVATSASSYEDSNTGNDDLDGFLDQASERIANFYQARRTETTMQALQTIANHLAGLQGRKNLIWLSSGFPLLIGQDANGSAMTVDFQNFGDDLQRTWRALSDVGIALYPVDARGLIGMADYSPSMSAASRPNMRRPGPAPMDTRAQRQIAETQGVMRELADRTGGRAFMNNNDIAGSIRRAMDDARVTYVLYYTPSHDEWDGRFREIKIKVNRPGLEARYRKGYYAIPDVPTDQKSRQAALTAVAVSPLASTGVTILARLMQKPTEDAPKVVVAVVFDGHNITFSRDAQGQTECTVDVMALVFGDQPAPTNQMGRSLHVPLKPEQYDQAMKTGVRVTLEVEAPVKSKRVRVIARDVPSGRVGSLDISLK